LSPSWSVSPTAAFAAEEICTVAAGVGAGVVGLVVVTALLFCVGTAGAVWIAGVAEGMGLTDTFYLLVCNLVLQWHGNGFHATALRLSVSIPRMITHLSTLSAIKEITDGVFAFTGPR
jgi:hypothetical protein